MKAMTPERIYKILLNLYPKDFRREYGEEMTQIFQESLRNEGSSFGFWARTFWDVISSASRERISGGWNMQNNLVKFGGVAAVIHGLVLPFLAILIMTKTWEPAKEIDGLALFTNLLFNGGLLPLIVVTSLFNLPQPRSRMEYLGCFLAFTAPLVFTIANQILIQNPILFPGIWFDWMYLIGRFGLPIGLALMGLARVRRTGIRDLPSVSKILFGLAVVLFITGTIWRVVTSNTLASDVIEPLGMTVFLVERLIWIPLAWVMLTSQKPSMPTRAQPA
jgi:hypothetical protein